MTKINRCVGFGVFTALLLAASAFAGELPKSTQVRVIHGLFAAETGQKVEFSVPEGGRLVIKNAENRLMYHLIPEILSNGRVLLRIVEPNATVGKAAQEIEVFDLDVNGRLKNGLAVPFSLAATSVNLQDMIRAPVIQNLVEGGGSCCLTCGGWRVCCYPSPGWCCDMSSSCGDSCSACSY